MAFLTDWICKRNKHNRCRETGLRDKLKGGREDDGEGKYGRWSKGRMLWQPGLWEFGGENQSDKTGRGDVAEGRGRCVALLNPNLRLGWR